MSISAEGSSTGKFREATANSQKRMAGVTFSRFWCKCCDSSRPIKGRKSAGWKAGFICAECAVK